MFKKILIANRGEIACRVIKTARRMNIETVAVYSDADQDALHVRMADESVHIGPASAQESYLSIPKIIEAAKQSDVQAIHPGYGFLSENKEFAEILTAEKDLEFIGPPPQAIEAMGDKIASKKIAAVAGVTTVPGDGNEIESDEDAIRVANEIGYPVMIKASAGGGGKGMRIAWDEAQVIEGFQSSKNEAKSAFGDDRVFIEKFITGPRHIEIQILADKYGNFVYLNERECSIQRRNQKIIEEAPSPFLDESTRKAMGEQAIRLAEAVGYYSAGTVEFIVDSERNFYFLEMNTRLQVEHPVTELITGIDLVEQMFRIAHGERLGFSQSDVGISGWAMESRIYAENPYRGFLPSTGRLTRYTEPHDRRSQSEAVRVDTGVYEGGTISVHYDPMIAKLCSWAESREKSIALMRNALDCFEIDGISCNIPFLSTVMGHPEFVSGEATTAFIEEQFPTGFYPQDLSQDELRQVMAAAVVMHRTVAIRAAKISGQMSSRNQRMIDDWVVVADKKVCRVKIEELNDLRVRFEDDQTLAMTSEWTPGQSLAHMTIDGESMVFKVHPITNGFRIRYRGADLEIQVWTSRQAEMSRHMPVKENVTAQSKLLCPMPGLISSINVNVGDSVEIGQALCTMEAMKMENILKAERPAVVKSVKAQPGDILAVDDVIMEFE